MSDSDPAPVLIKTSPAGTPAWVQIARVFLSDIQTGKRHPGETLPATTAIAAASGTSPVSVSVSRALRELTRAGVLTRDRARGSLTVTATGASRSAG